VTYAIFARGHIERDTRLVEEHQNSVARLIVLLRAHVAADIGLRLLRATGLSLEASKPARASLHSSVLSCFRLALGCCGIEIDMPTSCLFHPLWHLGARLSISDLVGQVLDESSRA
jgi:hypothetical protein